MHHNSPRGRKVATGIAMLMLATACGAGATGTSEEAPTSVNGATVAPEGSPPPFPWELAAQGVDVQGTVPLDEIRSGGPPPDGIPAIDDPKFESMTEAGEWLDPQDPLMIVEVDDQVRVYPLAILTYHEIVNDTLAGRALLVTYCPLCNSALVFDREVDGKVLDFGTSGRLWNSNLVMYDRQSRSLWAQFTGEAIVGTRTGQRLERLPAQIVSFSEVQTEDADIEVLSRDTGHSRPYGQNPYAGYDTNDNPFLFSGETGGPLPQIERVVTTGGGGDPVAYPLAVLRERRVLHDEVDGDPVVVLWTPGTASALDTADLSEGRDVGATGVFRPQADGRTLTFKAEGEGFVDEQTNSRWNVLGRGVGGPLEGAELEAVPHDDTFWFVQYAFRPETRVFGQE